MATDGPDPPPCDHDIKDNGTPVCLIHSISSNRLERFVVSIREQTSERVDWHFVGGRAVVKVLGDCDAARAAIDARKGELIVLMLQSHPVQSHPDFYESKEEVPPPLQWL